MAHLLRDRPTHSGLGEESGPPHQPTGPSASKKVPLGPSAGSVAAWTTTFAPSDGCCDPVLPLRSVALNPGHTELTLTGVSLSSAANQPVRVLTRVLDVAYA